MAGILEFRHLADVPEAVPLVASWWFDAWGPTRSCASAKALGEQLRRELSRNELPVQLIAVEEEQVVGTAVLKAHELKAQYPELKHWLGNVFVRPSERGRGVGAALVKNAEGLALRLGITKLHLATEHRSEGLYARLGYEILDRTRKGELEVTVMARNLDALVRVVPNDKTQPKPC